MSKSTLTLRASNIVTAYPSSDGGISVNVTALNGTQGKSLLLGGLPWEAVLVTTAASLLQQV